MHKTHIFDQKNNTKIKFLPTYLSYFFSVRYRKQTISFFRPNKTIAWSQVISKVFAGPEQDSNLGSDEKPGAVSGNTLDRSAIRAGPGLVEKMS